MLVLGRQAGQRVILTTASGERIVVMVVESHAGRTRLGFEAPKSVTIAREELIELKGGGQK